MYTTCKDALEALWMPLCLSMMGFLVRVARFGFTSWRAFVSSLVCSAFVGIIAHWFLAGSGMDVQVASAIIAMSGYCGGALLDAMHARIIKAVNEAPLPEPRPWDGVERRRHPRPAVHDGNDRSGAAESGMVNAPGRLTPPENSPDDTPVDHSAGD